MSNILESNRFSTFFIALWLTGSACQAPAPGELGSLRQGVTIRVPIRVPADQPTIQAAVNAAAAGDIIQIAPGEYVEEVTVGEGITLAGDPESPPRLRGRLILTGAAGARVEHLTVLGPASGSGVLVSNGQAVLFRVEVREFDTGILVVGPEAVGTEVLACALIGNGEGIRVTAAAQARIDNALVLFNSDDGVSVTASATASVTNATVVGSGAAGLWLDGSTAVTNTIAVNNATGLDCPGPCTSDHNLIWGNTANYAGVEPGPSDRAADPLFVDPGEHDFHLGQDSPAIDAGTPDGAPATDRDGLARPQGAGVDLGAYEHPAQGAGLTLVLTEVMANPIDEASGEFVELLNTSDQPLNAAGLVLSDGDASDVLTGYQGGPTVIGPGAYGLVLDPDYAGQYDPLPAGAVLLSIEATATLGNGLSTSDPISLLDPDGDLLATYAHPFNPGNGTSAERVDPALADVPGNWVPSSCGSSPGLPNCQAVGPHSTRLVISEVMANPIVEGTGEFVELYNAGPGLVNVAGYVLSDGNSLDMLIGYQGSSTEIPAGAYGLVLDPDYAGGYNLAPGAVLLTVGNAKLGNVLATSDPICLLTPDEVTLVDSFSSPINPGNGVSVEKVTLTGGDLAANWLPSPCQVANGAANDGASPGGPNCADTGAGVSGDKVIGEPCPYGAVDCISGLCLHDLRTYETYCTKECVQVECPTGFHCEHIVDQAGGGEYDLCAIGTGCSIDADLGSVIGSSVAAGSTAGRPDNYAGSCGGGSAPEVAYGWTAPAAGDYVFDTFGSSLGTVLYALDSDCAGAELACNDDAYGTSQSQLSLTLALGQRVILVIDGELDAGGAWLLNIALDPYAGLQGEALIQALHTLVDGHTGLGYTQARKEMFSNIDNVDGAVECVYTGFTLVTDTIPDNEVMNTEHTWAQSWGAKPWMTRTDLHQLFPTTNESNARRAAYSFGQVVSPTWTDGGSSLGTDGTGRVVFEPRDVHKGDVARALFYFSVRYGYDIPDVDEPAIRAWNVLDPPDGKEQVRNDKIHGLQHNRNPFVDHPKYVDRIPDF